MGYRDEISYLAQDKILAHPERIAQWMESGTAAPITMELDMTNACTHKCPGCAGGRNNQKSLSADFANILVRQIADFGIKGLIFTGGGEPLVNPATPKIVKLASDLGLDIGFITHGGLLNKEIAEILVNHCVWIRISVDASDAEMLEETHGVERSEFDRIWQNISLLVESKREMKSNCTIGLGYLTRGSTLRGIVKFSEMGMDYGVNYVQYRPFHYDKTIIDNELKEAKRFENENFKVIASFHKYELMKKAWKRSYDICFGHHFASVISADAKMYLCCHMRGKPEYVLGDLRHHSLKDIWFSERRRLVYENINWRDCPPMCRCDTFNEVLWNIYLTKSAGHHLNFL